MSEPIYEQGKTALVFSRGIITSLFESIPDNKLCFQPIPKVNHALWVAGHVATTDAFFLSNLAGQEKERFEAWKDIFFMGSTPKPDASHYPARAEVIAYLETGRAALLKWFGSMSKAQLASPLPQELAFFAPNYGALMSTIACHESMHAGQMTVVRKALGMDPAFA